jgi:hypothetical protein
MMKGPRISNLSEYLPTKTVTIQDSTKGGADIACAFAAEKPSPLIKVGINRAKQ